MDDLKHKGQQMIQNLAGNFTPGEQWTHYKGGIYEIVTLAVQENTGEVLVIYKSLKYGSVWSRTLDDWCAILTSPEGDIPRFKKGVPNNE